MPQWWKFRAHDGVHLALQCDIKAEPAEDVKDAMKKALKNAYRDEAQHLASCMHQWWKFRAHVGVHLALQCDIKAYLNSTGIEPHPGPWHSDVPMQLQMEEECMISKPWPTTYAADGPCVPGHLLNAAQRRSMKSKDMHDGEGFEEESKPPKKAKADEEHKSPPASSSHQEWPRHASIERGCQQQPGGGESSEAQWTTKNEAGCIIFETINVTSAHRNRMQMMASAAHVSVFQEHGLAPGASRAAAVHMKQAGWNMLAGPTDPEHQRS